MSRRCILSLALLFLLTFASGVNAQGGVDVQITRSPTMLTIYAEADEPFSLGTLEIQGLTDTGSQIVSLSQFEAFDFADYSLIDEPACFVFRLATAATPFPPECQFANVYVQSVDLPGRFWYDQTRNQPVSLILRENTNPAAFCTAAQFTCNLTFPFRAPPPPPALVDLREVLVLVADFDGLAAQASDAEFQWQVMLSEAAAALGEAVNLRIESIPQVIRSDDEARRLSDGYQATLVIWGRVSTAFAETHVTLTPRWALEGVPRDETDVIAVPDELVAFIAFDEDAAYAQSLIMAQLAYFSDDMRAALPHIDAALSLVPAQREAFVGSANLYFYRAYIYQNLIGYHEQALADYNSALRFDSGSAAAYNNRGLVFLAQERPERALSDFTRAQRLIPNSPVPHNNRGVAYDRMGDFSRAIADYDTALALDPVYARSYRNRGWAVAALEDYGRALGDYDRAIQFAPSYALAYYTRASTYQGLGQLQRALTDYDRAIQLDPHNDAAYFMRALVREGLRDFPAAARDMMEYVQARQAEGVRDQSLLFANSLRVRADAGTVYYLPFYCFANQRLTVSVTSPDGRVDPMLLLLDPQNTPLTYHDDINAAQGDYNAQLRGFLLSTSGEFTLVVTHAYGGSDGFIDILVSRTQ